MNGAPGRVRGLAARGSRGVASPPFRGASRERPALTGILIRTMRHSWSTLALAALAFLATPLDGQTISSPYRFVETRHTLGVYGGYISIDPGRNDQAPRSASLFGIRYDVRFAGPASGEMGFSLAPSERTIYRVAEDGQSLEALEVTNSLVGIAEAGLRFHFTGQRTWHGLAPYAVITGGVVSDITGNNVLETVIPADQFFRFGLGFASGFALGSDFFIGERFSLRAEVRDYLWRLSYPGGITGTGSRQSEWTHNFAPSIGGSYHF